MNKRILSVVSLGVVFLSIFLFSKCDSKQAVNVNLIEVPFQNLSSYHFFQGEIADLIPNEDVLPYDLNSALFSDYAFKKRFVWMPKDSAAKYQESLSLDFPKGTALIKNFYYPEDFAKPEGAKRIIETRLLIHQEDGWNAYPYIWNEAQTDAVLSIAGGFTTVDYIDKNGELQTVSYAIPNKIQCKSCHIFDEKIQPIGPKVRHLNKDFEYADGTNNQLEKWSTLGLLEGFDMSAAHQKSPVWDDESTGNLNDRAIAYLDINCGHCHNPDGPASTSGLNLYAQETDLSKMGVCKTPVAAGKGSGGFLKDIVPGQSDSSILVFRLASDDPSIMMPELGRTVVHKEGLALIKEWIDSMEGECQ